MATTLQVIVDQVRRHLSETTASFWTDNELVAHANRGIRDLWRAINNNYQDYFLTDDITNVSLAASAVALTGVPADVGVIRGIEPRVRANFPQLMFFPKPFMHPDFANARARSAFDPIQGGTIYWWATGAGGPVAAPTVKIAPSVSSAVPLRLVYIPTLTEKVISDANPIPGESDEAIIAWTVAHAVMKQRDKEDVQSPDPGWMGIYGTEKASILVSLAPRQTEDDDVAEAIFEPYW